jgi:hypothetical protein
MSGGSATPFTVALPPSASCSGDTATDGYHVYSYLVKKGTDVADVRFVVAPSVGYGIVDDGGSYYGAVNTAIKTGEIVEVPNNFAWAPLIKGKGGNLPLSQLLYSGSRGVWETGLACADTHGTLTNDWNAEVTFLADAEDPAGFVWKVDAPGSTGGAPAGGSGANNPSATASTGANSNGRDNGTGGSSSTGAHPTGGGRRSSGTTSASATASHPSTTASSTDDDAGSSDLPLIGIVAAGLIVVGAGLVGFRRLRRTR